MFSCIGNLCEEQENGILQSLVPLLFAYIFTTVRSRDKSGCCGSEGMKNVMEMGRV